MKAGETVAGRFQIELRAGSGATGTVYRAVNVETGARVGLKVFQPFENAEQRARFDREATVLAGLVHPAIVEYVAHGEFEEPEPRSYLAMEWLEGCTLADRLSGEPLDVAQSLRLLHRITEAVAEAHRRGIVHRDLKPANLFLRGGEIEAPVVLDFGLARAIDATRLTRTGVLLGTPLYMSPEQARGQAELDARADVFSLGAILYRCLTGQNAFYGDQVLAVLAKILVEEVIPPRQLCPDLPPAVDALVLRLLAKDPVERPADAAEVAIALADLHPGSTPITRTRRTTAGITHRALRPVCAVLGHPAFRRDPVRDQRLAQKVRSMALNLGGRLETLADGSYLIVFLEQSGTEQLISAARSALLLRDLTGAAVAVASGRTSNEVEIPIGEALDRAVRAIAQARPGEVAVDASMAGALESRFHFRPRGELFLLRGERTGEPEERTLLGRPSAMVGREPELALLLELCGEAIAERCARAAVVLAPAGTGKSRLATELLRRLLRRHPEVEILRGRGDALTHGSPFAPLAEMVRRYADIQEGGSDQTARGRLEERLAAGLAPARARAVSELLCHMLGIPVENDQFARSDSHLRGAAMRQAFVEWLAAETKVRPVVLLVDELQWADRPSLQFIDAALRELQSAPLIVLGLGRPETTERFPELWKKREVEQIALAGLKRSAAIRLARAHLGDSAPDELVERIVERAAGNAFFLEELIRAAASNRRDALPDTVLLVLHQRLDELSAEEKRTLRAASIFGRLFWSRAVAALLGIDADSRERSEEPKPERIDTALAALERREIIERRPHALLRGEVEYAFQHALVQEVAYATLTAEDRVHGHRLAGEWLEKHRVREPLVLAEHYTRGELPARAAQWYLQGALQALEGSDYLGARSRAERGLACNPDADLAARLWLAIAEAENWSGACAEAERAAERAATLVAEESALWYRALDERFFALARLGAPRAATAGEVLELISNRSPAPGAQRDALLCMSRAAILVVRLGRRRMAHDLVERIAALAGSLAELDVMTAMRVQAVRGLLARDVGDAELCLQAHADACRSAELAGDRPHLCLTRVSWASCLTELGAAGKGGEMLHEAMQEAQALGAPSVIAIAGLGLAECLLELGQARAALAAARSAAELGKRLGELHLEGRALVLAGRAELVAGEARQAVATLARGVELAGSFPAHRSVALARLAQALLATGNLDGARRRVAEALSLFEPTEGFGADESAILLAACEVEAAGGNEAETSRRLSHALDRIETRARKLSPTWQLGFLQVRENARLLELARQREL